MTSWLTSLSALAEKAINVTRPTWPPGEWVWKEEREFIAACSPERVRALCELAQAARESVDAEDEWHLRHGMGHERVPYRKVADAADRRVREALAAVEALEEAQDG